MCPGMQVDQCEGGGETIKSLRVKLGWDQLDTYKDDVILPYLDMCLITLVS